MERIVFLDRRTCKAPLRPPRFAHQWTDYDATPPGEVLDRLRDATIAVTNKVPLRERDLAQLRPLRLICVAATGVDCVDVAFCRQEGIAVANVPHYTRDSVPEHVFMLILALRRNLVSYRKAVEAGRWQKSPDFSLRDYPIEDLHGSTLGLIGYGELARGVEKLALAFGMRVMIAERRAASTIRPGRHSFDNVLRDSDVVSLHAPLTPGTHHLMGREEFIKMKPTALLINVARGGLVDEAALAHVLKTGLLGGAALDVLGQEPPPEEHPLIRLNLPNLIITPHVAWASEQSMQRLAEQVVANMEAFAAGKPVNLV